MNKHFVLVHSAGHGAWYWYKVKPLLESSGHQVTVLQLGPTVVNEDTIAGVTFSVYTKPLMDFMATLGEEKVILVGHSAGGLNLPLAMEQYPQKISVAVFITAFMPDTTHNPAYVVNEYVSSLKPDSETFFQDSYDVGTWKIFGPTFLKSTLYELFSQEEFALTELLSRPASFFQEELEAMDPFTEDGYGSVKKVYIVCKQDRTITEDFQRWMIENYPVNEVMEIPFSGHEVTLKRPVELSSYLFEIADKY